MRDKRGRVHALAAKHYFPALDSAGPLITFPSAPPTPPPPFLPLLAALYKLSATPGGDAPGPRTLKSIALPRSACRDPPRIRDPRRAVHYAIDDARR